MTNTLRQIYPQARELDPWEAYGDLRLRELASNGRPYVVANMVTTVDGDATQDGRAKGISSDLDRSLFHVLRTQVDAVMVGANTIRVENYGRLVPQEKHREHRQSLGLAPDPLAITVSGTMNLPVEAALVSSPENRLVTITNSDRDLPDGAAGVEVVRTPGPRVDLEGALRTISSTHGVETILLEGGPTLLGVMIGERLVDELFLTISPMLGGDATGPKIVEGPAAHHRTRLELKSLLFGDQSLFSRYGLIHES